MKMIKPIDLQTNIAQQLNVGKEIQIAHDQPVEAQHKIAEENQEYFKKQTETIEETEDVHNLKITDRERKEREGNFQRFKGKKSEKKNEEEKEKKQPLKRGGLIDIKI